MARATKAVLHPLPTLDLMAQLASSAQEIRILDPSPRPPIRRHLSTETIVPLRHCKQRDLRTVIIHIPRSLL